MPDDSQPLPPEVIERLRKIDLSDRLKKEHETSPSLRLILDNAFKKSSVALGGLMIADPTDTGLIVELQQHARLYRFMVETIDVALVEAEEAHGALGDGVSDYEE